MSDWISVLPHINASLNGLATVLLLIGYGLIKFRREIAHRNVMLAAFATSTLFLACYLTYHFNVLSKRFPSYPPDWAKYTYYAILLTHVALAISVPFLALATIYFGLRNDRQAHRAVARWCFPIWLYVSVTGVVVYLMLYQIYPPLPAAG